MPKHIEKEDLKKIFFYLDKRVHEAENESKTEKYNAHFYRALVRFLYTTGLRNTELRTLKLHDINLNTLVGQVLGKGNRYAAITFSEIAKVHLLSYLDIRGKTFPQITFQYVFTPYTDNKDRIISEQ